MPEVPESKCPACGHVVDRATLPGDESVSPRAGDFSVCIECGGVLVFRSDLTVDVANIAELLYAGPETRKMLGRVQAAIAEAKKVT